MKSLGVTIWIFFLACSLVGAAQVCEDDFSTRDKVRYIAILCQAGDSEWLFAELAKQPEKAICALVKQLNATEVKEIGRGEWRKKTEAKNQVWRIRALRFLTCGQDFTATIPYRPDKKKDPEDYWYWVSGEGTWTSKPGDPVEARFFHTWMSRDIDYIAPVEAQRDIIRQWREWLVKNGTNAGCAPNATDYNQWYF